MSADEDGGSSAEYFYAEDIKGNFTLFNQNIRSLRKNVMHLNIYVEKVVNVRLITMQEVWQATGNVIIPGFNIITKSRSTKRGGGVGIAVKTGIQYDIINSPFIEAVFESIGVKLEIGKKKYAIYSIYCPPKTPISKVLDYIKQIKMSTSKGVKIILAGDYNINILDSTNSEFLDTLSEWSIQPLYQCPTRVTKTSQKTHIFRADTKNIEKTNI